MLPKDNWFQKLRSNASVKFNISGYPTAKNEDWKYTSLKKFQTEEFQSARPHIGFRDMEDILSENTSEKMIRQREKDISEIRKQFPQIEISFLSNAILEENKTVKNYLNVTSSQGASKPFFWENTSRFVDGILIHVPKGLSLDIPLYSFLAARDVPHSAYYIRNLIILEEGSSLRWVEDYMSENQQTYLNQIVNEIILKPNSRLKHIKIQREGRKAYHFGLNHVLQHEGSNYSSHELMLGSQMARNENHVKMLDEIVNAA